MTAARRLKERAAVTQKRQRVTALGRAVPAARERSQVVVALGEGNAGAERWLALRAAAEAEGLTLSEWAREILLAAAKQPPMNPLAARLPLLERQVREMQQRSVNLEALRVRVEELELATRDSSVDRRLDDIERRLGIPGP